MSPVRKIPDRSFSGWTFLKRVGLLALLGVVAVLTFPDAGFARVFKVYGVENFVRSGNRPVTEVREFQVKDPDASEFTMHIFYLGIKKDFQGVAPSALVKLNGMQIVAPGEFSRNAYYIRKPVTLSEENALSVELRGKPGSGIRIVITGRNDEPQLVYFHDLIHPDGSGLFGTGTDLTYLWSIIGKPGDASAVFSDPGSPGPLLQVDRPGEYSLQLRIRTALWESEPFTVTLTAMEYPPYVPVPVQSRVISGTGDQYQDYAIKVGPNTYTAPAPTNCGSPTYEGFQVLVLDRASLAFKDHRTFNVPCGRQALATYLYGLDNNNIVIVSSLKGAEPVEVCDIACSVGMRFEILGGTNVYALNPFGTFSYTLPDGTAVPFSYSLIGIPGLGPFQGTEMNNWEHRAFRQEAKIRSNISGYFVQDASTLHKWTFVWPEFTEIETRAQPTDGSNTIKVGGTSYVSKPLKSGAEGGFQVLWLDGDTLMPAASINPLFNNRTYSTNAGAGNDSVSAQEQQAMETDLTYIKALAEGYGQKIVAVISSIGTPIQYKSSAFSNLSKTVGYWYGGTAGIFNQLGTAPTEISTYSLVGALRTGAPYGLGASGWVEASSDQSSTEKEDLRVVLHKDGQGWYQPSVTSAGKAAADGGPDFGLLQVALQAPTPWPLPDPDLSPTDPVYQRQLAAYQYISNNLGQGTNDIRSKYTMRPIDPSLWVTYCVALQYPASPSPYFTQDDFNAMRAQLCGPDGEFNYVNTINGFMDDMDVVLINMQLSSSANLNEVYNAVRSTVYVPDDGQIRYDAGIVIRGLLTAGTSIVKNPAIKGVMGVVNGAMSIAMSLSKKENGADYTAIDTQASALANEMDNLWKSCKAGNIIALDMIKSDWGKLRYAGQKFTTPQSEGGWQYSDTDRSDWVTIVTNDMEVYYFQSLIPAVWKIDYVSDSSTIPAPKNFEYHAGGSYTCNPYCDGASANPTAYWVDSFPDGRSTWYVLENGIDMAKLSGCGYVVFDHSASLRKILFGSGDWKDSAGNVIGVNLNLSLPLFYERWLPSSVYRPPTMPLFDEVDGYYGNCSD